VSKSRLLDIPPQLIVDRAVQRGLPHRDGILETRKNDEAYVLDLPEDVVEAIRWHIKQGYAGEEFLFSKDGMFPKYMDSHQAAMWDVQESLGLKALGHQAMGRRSVASQASSKGEPLKAIQSQLGHRSAQSTHAYIIPDSGPQLRLVSSLTPSAPPHVNRVSTGHD
jgi:integrase